jgi:hypothetical protein
MKLTFKDLKQQKFVIEAEPSELISDVKEKNCTGKRMGGCSPKADLFRQDLARCQYCRVLQD